MTQILTRSVNSIHQTLQLPFQTQNRPGAKPDGLWYGIGDSWIDWVREKCPPLMEHHNFSIQVDAEKICRLNSEEELKAFLEEMAVPLLGHPSNLIDWSKVAGKYAGIEISQAVIDLASEYPWLEDWGTASGCIWDSAAILRTQAQAVSPPDSSPERK